jgi:CubicO group peptidase (beta-lactamase class C family)
MYGQRSLSQVPEDALVVNQLKAMSVDDSYPCESGETFARGGIGLFSTIADYLQFMSVLQTGRSSAGEPILSDAMLEFMWLNRLNADQMPISIGQSVFPGYGWGLTGRIMCNPAQSMLLTSLGEGGWAGAASTYFWVDRKRAFSGVVMAQYLGSAIPLGPDIQALSYSALE